MKQTCDFSSPYFSVGDIVTFKTELPKLFRHSSYKRMLGGILSASDPAGGCHDYESVTDLLTALSNIKVKVIRSYDRSSTDKNWAAMICGGDRYRYVVEIEKNKDRYSKQIITLLANYEFPGDVFTEFGPTISLYQTNKFPHEIMLTMLERAKDQDHVPDIRVFWKNPYAGSFAKSSNYGFNWENTPEGTEFWVDVIKRKNFNKFFEKYSRIPGLEQYDVLYSLMGSLIGTYLNEDLDIPECSSEVINAENKEILKWCSVHIPEKISYHALWKNGIKPKKETTLKNTLFENEEKDEISEKVSNPEIKISSATSKATETSDKTLNKIDDRHPFEVLSVSLDRAITEQEKIINELARKEAELMKQVEEIQKKSNKEYELWIKMKKVKEKLNS